ncbi:hypothetical protein EBT31_05450 [bacterium]|nr:hypothetical protein [bacterium]
MDEITETPTEQKPVANRQTAAALTIAKNGEHGLKGLVEFIKKREADILSDMDDYRQWRQKSDWYMKNELEFRKSGEENIFKLRNKTLGAVRSGITFKVAKAQQDIFASTPWLNVAPEGNADMELAEKLGNHAQWKLRQAGAKVVGDEAIERAFWYGESVLRLAWDTRREKFERKQVVVVDPSGQPLTDAKGNFVTADSLTTTDEATGVPMFVETPEIEYPSEGGNRWEEYIVKEEVTTYDGLRFIPINWRSFRCSMAAKCIPDSHFRGHEYQLTRSEIRTKLVDLYGEQSGWPQEIADLFEKTGNAPQGQQTEENQERSADPGDDNNPLIKCFDAEIFWAPSKDAEAAWYFVTILPEYPDVPLFVDYLANVLPINGTTYRSVYHAVAVNRMDSWAGRSDWELFEPLNNEVDEMWNETRWRDGMIANPMSVVDESVIEERIEEVTWQPGTRLRRKKGSEGKAFIETVQMPETNGGTREDMNYLLMTNQLETGVTSAARGGIGDMPATNTATGIQSVLSSGSVLHAKPIGDCKEGFECLFTSALTLLYAKHDKQETFTYGEGENQVVATLGPEDVRDLTLNVTLTMTRASNTEKLENARVAIGAFMQYVALPPQQQQASRPLFVQTLQAASVKNADKIIAAPTEEMMQPPAPNPLEHIKVSYADLPPVAKAQVLAAMGIQVAPEDLEEPEEPNENENEAEANQLNAQ